MWTEQLRLSSLDLTAGMGEGNLLLTHMPGLEGVEEEGGEPVGAHVVALHHLNHNQKFQTSMIQLQWC